MGLGHSGVAGLRCSGPVESGAFLHELALELSILGHLAPAIGVDHVAAVTGAIGLFKTEVIHRRGPWRSFESFEFATLEWVDWFNNRRLLEPIGNVSPAEAEAA